MLCARKGIRQLKITIQPQQRSFGVIGERIFLWLCTHHLDKHRRSRWLLFAQNDGSHKFSPIDRFDWMVFIFIKWSIFLALFSLFSAFRWQLLLENLIFELYGDFYDFPILVILSMIFYTSYIPIMKNCENKSSFKPFRFGLHVYHYFVHGGMLLLFQKI